MKISHFLFLFSALVSTHASAASFLNDFSSTPFANENTDAQWSVGNGTYTNVAGAATTSTASFTQTGIRGSDFTISTQFTISSLTTAPTGGVSTVGFGALSLSSTFAGTANNSPLTAFYLADFGYAVGSGNTALGRLRVIALGDTSGTTAISGLARDGDSGIFAIQTDTIYSLRMTGTYSGGTLTMVLGLYNAAGVQIGTPGSLTDSSPLEGDIFGYRNRADTAGSTNVSFDNYALQTVPEPSAFALTLSAAALLIVRRKRAAR